MYICITVLAFITFQRVDFEKPYLDISGEPFSLCTNRLFFLLSLSLSFFFSFSFSIPFSLLYSLSSFCLAQRVCRICLDCEYSSPWTLGLFNSSTLQFRPLLTMSEREEALKIPSFAESECYSLFKIMSLFFFFFFNR